MSIVCGLSENSPKCGSSRAGDSLLSMNLVLLSEKTLWILSPKFSPFNQAKDKKKKEKPFKCNLLLLAEGAGEGLWLISNSLQCLSELALPASHLKKWKMQRHCLQLASSQLLKLHSVPKQHSSYSCKCSRKFGNCFWNVNSFKVLLKGKVLSKMLGLSELPRQRTHAYGLKRVTCSD